MGGRLKIKYKDIPRIKTELAKKQGVKCKICSRSLLDLKVRDICLDHNHKTGVIRGVLCRGCNSMEGKVFRAFQRVGLQKQGVPYHIFLYGLFQYYTDTELQLKTVTDVTYIHPKFKEKGVKK